MNDGTKLSRQQRRALERQQQKAARPSHSRASTSDSFPDAFRQQRLAFRGTLKGKGNRGRTVRGVMGQAIESFDATVAIQAVGLAPVACRPGCSSCCSIRVTATAPEILLMADYLRDALPAHEREELEARLIEADAVTRGLDDDGRDKLGRPCPFLGDDGACRVYPVRPFGCRGHTSYDRDACIDAADGKRDTVPSSLPHLQARSFVHGTLQAAMKDTGYAWDQYEMNHALRIVMEEPDAEAQWLAGKDPMAPARDNSVSRSDMEAMFRFIASQR